MSPNRVLVPFGLPDAAPVPPALVETLARTEVVALGHYGLPEQPPPAAAREQFEGAAREELAGLVPPLETAGVPVRTRPVFSSDRETAIDRCAAEDDCGAILAPGRVDGLDRLFVALRGDPDSDRTLPFVAELLTATDASATLLHTSERILASARDRLVERGVDPGRICQHLSERDDVGQRVADPGDECDLLVVGERAPSPGDQVLGTAPVRTTVDADDPAFVVRSPDRS